MNSSEDELIFTDEVYQEAWEIDVDVRRISHVPQKRIMVCYKGRASKQEYIADSLRHDQIVVEFKVIKVVTGLKEARVFNYLKATNLPLGLIINFGAPQLE